MSPTTVNQFCLPDLSHLSSDEAVSVVMQQAVALHASDLYVLSNHDHVELAARLLGTVHKLVTVTREQGRYLISHIKATAGMDISERRKPRDGRWLHRFGGSTMDMRISCIPTLYGEDVAIRIWDHTAGLRDLNELGMSRADLQKITLMLSRPSGLVLVTGPTGTGKTTTLYACLKYLNDGSRKINTLEDPIEYAIPGIRQSQVNTKIHLDFPELLRSVLRQAPDVIMLGEIRDEETAATAVRAASSGHLVLATLHAPAASLAVQSMMALGANPFFLSSCLLGVIAQRLVRTLCVQCRVFYDISVAPQTFAEIQDLLTSAEGSFIYGPSGCDRCYHLGYAGRTGLFEIMTMNHELRRCLAEGRPREEIQQAAVRAGMLEFRKVALLKVAQGITSTEEILRDIPAEQLGLED